MPGIKHAMKDILTKLGTLQISNGDGTIVPPTVRVWNNQLAYLRDGRLEGFVLPAFLLEVVSPNRYKTIGQGFRTAIITFRIHILHEFYNQEGTFEQDLEVFEIRDSLLVLLTLFQPSGCGVLTCVGETQDDSHDNIYHYRMDFDCDFTDSKASPWDEDRSVYIDSTPPLNLEVDVELETSISQPPYTGPFQIPSR